MDRDGDWINIGFVEGQGDATTPQFYQHFDRQPLSGINYYRLKQWDNDGRFEISDVVSVSFEQKDIQIAIFPNPADYELRLDQAFSGTLLIHDALGRVYWKADHAEALEQIDISSLPAGTFFLELVSPDNQWQTLPFMVQR